MDYTSDSSIICNSEDKVISNCDVNLNKNKKEEIKSDADKNFDKNKTLLSFITNEDLVWSRILGQFLLLIVAAHCFLNFPYVESYKTFIFAYLSYMFAMFGICAGVHRLWTHRAYKAKLPLRIILAFAYYSCCMMPVHTWVSIHRVHHRYADTDLDPHNSKRGFFFAHLGWTFIKRPKAVVDKLKSVDMSDVEADPVVMFCDRHFNAMGYLITFVMIALPVLLWNESWYISTMAFFMRLYYVMHVTLSVNSFAHLWGYKPYDKKIAPVYNKAVNYLTLGEGLHNYHHTFPSDYRTPEFDSRFDFTGQFIRLFAKIGWAYDLNEPSEKLAKMVIDNRGDANVLKTLL